MGGHGLVLFRSDLFGCAWSGLVLSGFVLFRFGLGWACLSLLFLFFFLARPRSRYTGVPRAYPSLEV